MIFRTLVTLFMCCAVLFANSAEAVVTNDSIQTASESTKQAVPGERFNIKQLIVPTVLVSVGAFGIKNGWFHKKINEPVRDGLADLRRDNYVKIDDYIQYLPVAAHLGMGLVGVESRHPFRERFVAAATSSLVMAAMVNTIKNCDDEERPNSHGFSSFPSGHTATAFMGAELIRLEYGNDWCTVGAYTVACGVGFLRLYNNKHWLNDVLAGAGIGILSARIGYWMLPVWRHLFRWDRTKAPAMSAVPTYDAYTRSFGVAFAAQF